MRGASWSLWRGMDTSLQTERTARHGLRALLASGSFRRLWAVGALGNAMRFSDTLAAALFTWQVTGSGFEVAVVSAMRALPMLLFGAFAGVVSDSVNRKAILQWGMVVSGAASASVCALAAAGVLRPWHVAVAAFVGGTVWATEMSTRRRMCGEAAGAALMGRAVALDSLTNAMTRGIGPLVGGAIFATLGAVGAYAVSAVCFVLAALLIPGVRHVQETRRLTLGRVPRDLAEGLAYARTDPTVRAVLLVTIVMNCFAFSYSALVAPLALVVFRVSLALSGLMASSEAFGSLLGGIVLAAVTPRTRANVLMVGGSVAFLLCAMAMTQMPNYWLACAMLVLGGIGSALFGNMQTTLVLTRVPPAVRSRQMGLITVCIGFGPVGQLMIGALAERLGPQAAVLCSAVVGLVLLLVVGAWWGRAERRAAGGAGRADDLLAGG